MSEREDDLERRLGEVRERIASACRSAGRDPDEVTLVVVTKFFPASDVRVLADLGVRDVGENRHQEAAAKAEELVGLPLRWHFIGGLQSNKAAAVATYADAVHSLDRAKLVTGLSRGATERGRDLDVLVQVSLDPPGADGRSGADPDQVGELAARVAEAEGLVLRGVMGVAPLGGDAGEAFARLAEVAADVRRDHPGASWISAGMSGDLDEAIARGATHLRVGSAVLGPRPESK
ncbi:alanine racemase [Marmoricola sp. Leaf446]|uniref:YggS family pyridoxal phosphate-dependent enzyme n=1 Tax=Marmoricola sp. Leaf446 TaxID=1736379 RepID=UPI0006FA448F|nr:YggS family pyridoxal phosphate-dependent enzyme [Marmoricola sp. Leaf446]KQT91169.1 alanine racemase [Marmoricola sp. Leaf446]